MIEVKIDTDEWYPVYFDVSDYSFATGAYTVKMTEEQYADYKNACAQFDLWQDWLEEQCQR